MSRTDIQVMEEAQKECILKNLLEAESWETRLRLLIQLGNTLPEYPPLLRNEKYLIGGCVSEVYFSYIRDPETGLVYFWMDTDVRILKGLAAFLLLFCQGKLPSLILGINFETLLIKYRVVQHLSQSRSDSLGKIIKHLHQTMNHLVFPVE